jgi:molybdate transport system regulatory protein
MAKSIKHIFRKRIEYKVNGALWIECGREKFFGPGRLELLERIDKTGSLNRAAREMGMSYKKAWEMINSLNSQSGHPLVILKSGGENGGGSVITKQARELIMCHRLLRKRFEAFLDKETKQLQV